MLRTLLQEDGAKRAFLEKLDIFQQNPGLLEKYLIGSEVSLEVLDLFLTRLFGSEGFSAVTDTKEAIKSAMDLFLTRLFGSEGISAVADVKEAIKSVMDLPCVEEKSGNTSEKLPRRSDEHWAVVEELQQQVLDLTRQFSALQQQLQMQEKVSQVATSLEGHLDEATSRDECDLRVVEADETLHAEICRVDVSSRVSDVARDLEELKNDLGMTARAEDLQKLAEDVSRLKKAEQNLDILLLAFMDEMDDFVRVHWEEIQGKIERIGMKSDPLDGIIAHLTREYGGNVHEKEIVHVTASSRDFNWRRTENVVDLESDWIFCSGYSPNQWICYDFIERRVIPTSYSVRSIRKGPGNEHPRSWVLEVSNDGIGGSWVVLDSRENNSDLNDNFVTHNFSLAPHLGAYRFVRLRLTGKNHFGNHQLIIAALEIFGALSSE